MIRPFIASSPSQVFRGRPAEPDEMMPAGQAAITVGAAKGHAQRVGRVVVTRAAHDAIGESIGHRVALDPEVPNGGRLDEHDAVGSGSRVEGRGHAEGEAHSGAAANGQRRRASNSSATLLSLSSSASASMVAKSSTPMSPYAFCTRWPQRPMSFTVGTMRVKRRVRNWRI